MPAKPPTPKLRALGAALRRAREARGLGVRELARQIDDDPGALSRYEKGERATKPEKIAQILATLGVNGQDYESIMALTRDAEGPLWVAVSLPERQHQMDALLEFESTATQITTVNPLVLPGLLQTRDYTHGIMSTDIDVPPNEIRMRVTVRAGRKDILKGDDPIPLLALIGESALDVLVGTTTVMTGQMRHLLEMGERDNVTVQVIPKLAGWNPSLMGMFYLIDSSPVPMVQLETRRSMLFLHEEADVDAYRRAADEVSQVALSPADSATLIAEYITRWESTSVG